MKGESGIKNSDESDIQINKLTSCFQDLPDSPHARGHK